MDDFEDRGPRRAHGGPYTSKHPVPTVQKYRQHRAEIKERQNGSLHEEEVEVPDDSNENLNTDKTAPPDQSQQHESPYPTTNRHLTPPSKGHEHGSSTSLDHDNTESKDDDEKSPTETAAASIDPKTKRKTMKKKSKKQSKGTRQVTDPVTHLPVVIHDMTDKDLDALSLNEDGEDISEMDNQTTNDYAGMRNLFPPPHFGDTKREMVVVFRQALSVGIGGMGIVSGLVMIVAMGIVRGGRRDEGGDWWWERASHHGRTSWWQGAGRVTAGLFGVSLAIAAGLLLVHMVTHWLSKKVDSIFEDETWDAARQEEVDENNTEEQLPESAAWLNSLLSSVWRLVNPDLFASLIDTLEDVMQASLPKVVRMVSVDDIGQGSEAIKILGIRWLPSGAAGESVDSDGNITSGEGGQGDNLDTQEQENEGMEGEEGDFINMELAFSYRARSSGKTIKSKAKNAHLYLKFYLPGGIGVPVWVELKGIVGIMRLRLQLTPDPPFFQLCTLTFLGQPRADISCVPLSKHNLNLMNVPVISSFVQSAIDAALAEYVAPKSLTLDLKDMLVGDDFKRDTIARGVIVVHIKKARGFKEGDAGFGPFKGSSDSYVCVSWGKFGKPVACTRIIKHDQEPNWNEWAYILVSPDEINADENLRLQLWDSDKHTADDDLGRTEISLKKLMHSSETKNKMSDREDSLKAEDPDEEMPGTLTWSVGYFSKAHIQQCQLDKQTFEPTVRTVQDMKNRVSKDAKSKLREAFGQEDADEELTQQTSQDLKELEDYMIASAPPPNGYLSGILSVQIHNITGLEVAQLSRSRDLEDDSDNGEHDNRDPPDGYCNIILNHTKIYQTRTKPKNANPFFNAGTERFVKDWKNAEVIVSVRDSREGENDPLLGVVYLPLSKVFATRSQVMETYPLAGGIGYGKVRISMVWRSVELNLPRELSGWDWGTIEVKSGVKLVGSHLPDELKGCKLKMKTKIDKAKMYHDDGGCGWSKCKGRKESADVDSGSVFLAFRKRYATSLIIQFKTKSSSPALSQEKKYPGFACLWLGDIPDEEEKLLKLKVWKGGKEQLKRARGCSWYEGLEEREVPLGEIELTVRLWKGLSGYHKNFAHGSGNQNVRGVIEVLDTVNDQKMADDDTSASESTSSGSDLDSSDSESSEQEVDAEKRRMLRKAGGDSGSSSDSDSELSDANGVEGGVKKILKAPSRLKSKASSLLDGKIQGEDDGQRGMRSQIHDYNRDHKRFHRKHRGVMQWKAARTVDWMMDKARDGKGKISQKVKHHGEKDGNGVETEV
ncbi:hypothetical protein QBC38DRAFT_491622 [Podospora fimiseda]|uniref:Meiotically up-regulated gene 190 protein n=1 Tax=Podospora fimiseda TaxID=252190 RepID=A0AAN6YPQ8_9PEZI|nr:hypothetical protein QBC38DRAFT_491622 [Podospora fimiseda]